MGESRGSPVKRGKWAKIAELAEELQCTREALLSRVQAAGLSVRKPVRDWLVFEEEYLAWLDGTPGDPIQDAKKDDFRASTARAAVSRLRSARRRLESGSRSRPVRDDDGQADREARRA